MGTDRPILLEPDERGRVSLGRIPGARADRYLARALPDGTVVLEPVVVIPVRAVESFERALAARDARRRSGSATTPLTEVLSRAGQSAHRKPRAPSRSRPTSSATAGSAQPTQRVIRDAQSPPNDR